MGKDAAGDQRQRPPDGADGGGGGGGEGRDGRFCCSGGRRGAVKRLQCVAALVLGAAVLLSALFWLPPFAGRGSGAGEAEAPDPNAALFLDDIVASFRLQKTVPELQGNQSKLELDIYAEIGIPNSTVAVDLLHPLAGSNWTNVVFSIVPNPKDSNISSTWLSIIRSSFMSLVVRQSTLHLTESVFGNSSSFEVLKFPGGITITPVQSAFLPQKPHATFNFTLNFPIYKVQDRIDELRDQMKTALLLNSNENLYFKLGNLQGSTILPPTIVETYIVRVVGNPQPSVPRMKQLAQKITNSSSGNLGLNHTVFGKVKQIRLSSYLRHSLHSRGSYYGPSQAPMQHHGHHGHHHRHHGHGDSRHLAPPAAAPINSPVHTPKYIAPPPSGCPYGKKAKNHVTPAAEPVANDPAASPPHPLSPSVRHPPHDPSMHSRSPVPSPPVLPESPLPTVSFGDAHPPSERPTSTGPSAGMSHVAPAPQSSNASSRRRSCHWILVVPLICCALLRSLL